MLSLANFSSGGREEGKKKSPLSQELLSSKQGKMNSLLEGSRTFLNPHLRRVLGLLLSVPTSSARLFKGALAARSRETPRKDVIPLPRRDTPSHRRSLGTRAAQLRGKGRSGAANRRKPPFPERTGGLTEAAHGPGNSPCLQPLRCLLHTHIHTQRQRALLLIVKKGFPWLSPASRLNSATRVSTKPRKRGAGPHWTSIISKAKPSLRRKY